MLNMQTNFKQFQYTSLNEFPSIFLTFLHYISRILKIYTSFWCSSSSILSLYNTSKPFKALAPFPRISLLV